MPLSGKGTASPNPRFGIVGDDLNVTTICSLPEPNRHRRDNEPVDVEDVHREAAGLLGISVKSHRQGRHRNRASPLRSQTCPINLYPQSDRSLEPLHGGGSDAHAAAEEKRDNAREVVGRRHCAEDLSKALITTLCIWTWSIGGANQQKYEFAQPN